MPENIECRPNCSYQARREAELARELEEDEPPAGGGGGGGGGLARYFRTTDVDDNGDFIWVFEDAMDPWYVVRWQDRGELLAQGRNDIITYIEARHDFSGWREKCQGCLASVENCLCDDDEEEE